jgi:oligosaccharide repeat unit polymerase
MLIFFAYILCLIVLFLAFRLHDKYDPARYFSIIWGGQIILIYTLFHNSLIFTGYGLVYISISCIIFSFGTIAGRLLGNKIPSGIYMYTLKLNRALLLLKICFFISLINVIQAIYANGFNIMQIISFKILLELNSVAATNRYANDTPSNIISQITLIFVYLTPLFGGYLLPLLSKRKKYWCYLSLLSALLITLTQAVKLGFINSIALWGIGVIVSSYANNNTFFRIRLVTTIKILFFSILFFTILFLSMIFRSGEFDLETIQAMSQKFILYAFGHLPTFDLWFTKNIGHLNPTGGVKTFYGITNYLGIAQRNQGVFTDLTSFGKNNFSGMSTNIYTMFRFILEDYGLFGSILMLFITGIISGFTWLMIKKQTNILLFQTILIGALFFISMSFATSVWAYTSFILTIALMHLLIILSLSKT